MKKLVSGLVVAAMMLGSVPGFAADNGKMENVLKDVKSRIGNTDAFDEFESSESEYNGDVRYEFNWSTSDRENYRYMNVATDDDGLICSYNSYEQNGYSSDPKLSINKISSADAMKRAEELMDKLNPDLAEKLILENSSVTESLYGNEFGFNIVHIENGIEVYGDGGYVSYDAKTDKITNYHLTYSDEKEWESVESAVSREEAQKSYMENFGLRLYYMLKTDDDGEKTYIPVYAPVSKPNMYINANTNTVEEIGTPTMGGGAAFGAANEKTMLSEAAADTSAARLTEVEKGELEKVSGLLSKDELVKLAKSNKYIEVSSDFELGSYRVSKSGSATDSYVAYIEFTRNTENEYAYITFRFDAKTGEIIYCSKYENGNKDDKLDKDKAEKLAEEVVKDFAGKKLEEYKADEDKTDAENGRFVFTRYVNDIPVDNDTISVTVGKNNKLSSYRISYSTEKFESVENVIAPNMAAKALFGVVEYKMVYMPQTSSEDAKEYDTFVPVYVFDEGEPMIIDAKTAQQLNYSGNEYKPNEIAVYSDIEGHYAEEAITALAKYGISFEGSEFRPNEKITQKDFMVLVNSAFGNGGVEPYPIAKRRGIIKEEEIGSEEEVSREMAAVFMIRGMGAEEYAKLEGIFVKPFEDVESSIGAIAILKGMGVFQGDENGRFNPTKTITRADSAIMIYNYLSR